MRFFPSKFEQLKKADRVFLALAHRLLLVLVVIDRLVAVAGLFFGVG